MALHFVEDCGDLSPRWWRATPSAANTTELAKSSATSSVMPALRGGMFLIDISRRSGRLSSALSASDPAINYLGTDVVQKLLHYLP